MLRAALSARPAARAARLPASAWRPPDTERAALCAKREMSNSVTASLPLLYRGLSRLAARPVSDCSQLDCQHPSLDHFGGASSTVRSADGGSHSDRPTPATMTRVAHSARPTADCAQIGCPHPPRAHRYHVGRALRAAVGESQCDSPAPAPMRRVAHSAWPTAHSAQLSCPRHNPP